jgi:hypothetical protein
MSASEWTSVLLGLLLVAVVAALAWLGLRGERYRCSQVCSFVCPRSRDHVECELVWDMRTGQWKDVRSCSLYAGAERVPCEWECARRLNMGFSLEGWQQRLARPAFKA